MTSARTLSGFNLPGSRKAADDGDGASAPELGSRDWQLASCDLRQEPASRAQAWQAGALSGGQCDWHHENAQGRRNDSDDGWPVFGVHPSRSKPGARPHRLTTRAGVLLSTCDHGTGCPVNQCVVRTSSLAGLGRPPHCRPSQCRALGIRLIRTRARTGRQYPHTGGSQNHMRQ